MHIFSCEKEAPAQKPFRVSPVSTKRVVGKLKILSTKPARLNRVFESERLIKAGTIGNIQVGDASVGISDITFKPGDVNDDVLVRFRWDTRDSLLGGAVFSPHGLTFNTPVRIRLSYKDADLKGVNEENLRIWHYNETAGKWEFVGGLVDKLNKRVEGYLIHFSRYALAAE